MNPLLRIYRRRATKLLVELERRAGSWREAASDAEFAFRSWGRAAAGDRAAAAASYLAAIEREEKAAQNYRDCVHAYDRRERVEIAGGTRRGVASISRYAEVEHGAGGSCTRFPPAGRIPASRRL
jgi:hypothetical protein